MEIRYVGEHLLTGQIGNLLVVIAFVSALLSTVSYFIASLKSPLEESWKRIGRISFYTHSIAVIGIISLLLWMLNKHYFEFYYIWEHSSKDLPLRFVFAALWEGQEGSFLLWAFWHVIIGVILLRKAGSWESGVLAVLSSVQIFIMSMLLGVYILDWKMGSNPFTELLRNHFNISTSSIFADPDYLHKIDGKGMNPLLQNYWMTIHPPVLFLGFALTSVPFAYAIAALLNKKFIEWSKHALPWTFAGIMILGTGILMGGAWAYEALSFGGFWAWDPVENSSLVPWLTLVGAGHLILLNRRKEVSSFYLFFFSLITFILVLYSTFLTRSGVLGDASVHAFTDMGMSGQLLIYLLFYFLLSLFLLVRNYKFLAKTKTEEAITSREFWMFIGCLVLLISSFQIIITTSIPLINRIFGTVLAPPVNPIEHYNAWQIPFAIIITLLIVFSQYLNYRYSEIRMIFTKLLFSGVISLLLSILIAILTEYKNPFHIVLLFTCVFVIIANTNYFLIILKSRIYHSGAAIAHVGIGMILLGALLSNSTKEIISQNSSSINLSNIDSSINNHENILLMKGDTLSMGNYLVTYQGKTSDKVNILYKIDYLIKEDKGAIRYAFSLYPKVQLNERFGNVPEPDIKHFWNFDIYTHVTYASLVLDRNDPKGFTDPVTDTLLIGDTISTDLGIIILKGIKHNIDRSKYNLKSSEPAIGFNFTMEDSLLRTFQTTAVFALKDTFTPVIVPGDIEDKGVKIAVINILPKQQKYIVSYVERKHTGKDFIIMKAIIFPWINILWTGCILLIIGSVISIIKRIRDRHER